jgi:myo-inositol-1(or 4)-monophosphatase
LQVPKTHGSADEDLDRAMEAVREAGDMARKRFRTGVKAWRKADGTPVSDVDLEVDKLLRELLAQARPYYGWHSEESQSRSPLTSERFWLVDPIDGTIAFLGDNDSWCISLALIEKGRPILGIIHAPAQRTIYSAVHGRGAKLNGVPISVSSRQNLEGARLIVNPSALKPQRWQNPLPMIERLTVPSLALRLAHVAQGLCDGALALSYKHDWDLAAGDLLVREAQGVISDLDGRALRYDPGHPQRSGFVGANHAIHAALLARGPLAIGQS